MATIVLPPDHPLCNPDWQPTTINEGTFEGVNIAQPTWDQAADNIISYDGVLCGDTDIIDWNGSLCATIDIADWDEYTCAGIVFDYLTTTPYAINAKEYIIGNNNNTNIIPLFVVYGYAEGQVYGDASLYDIFYKPAPQGYGFEELSQEQEFLSGAIRGFFGYGNEELTQDHVVISAKSRGVIYDNAEENLTQDHAFISGTMVTE